MAFKTGSYTVIPDMDANTHGSPLHSGRGGDTGNSDPAGTGNAYWSYPGATGAAHAPGSSGWRYRSIFTHGYLAAGYKGSNAWRAINKTWHQTDTTLYCGEQLDREGSYLSGCYSDHNAYIENNGHATGGTNLSSYSLSNGQTRKITTAGGFSSSGVSYGYVGYDPQNQSISYGTSGYGNHVGGWNFSTTVHDCASATGMKTQEGYWGGGTHGTAGHSLHMTSEVMYTSNAGTGSGLGTGASGENRGWLMNAGNSKYYYTWSTRTTASGGSWTYGTDGQPKAMTSKWGHHYVGTGNNVTNGQHKFSDANGTVISSPTKNHLSGEENAEEGQDHGYNMGDYNNQQNNWTVKYNYSTDAQTTMGATCQPKGHYGQSSGYCSAGAASVCDVGVG